jgi:prepilin peptidase CpaA
MIQLLQAGAAVAFAILVIVAALKDLTSYTIPNWISLALIGVFPVAALTAGVSLPTIGLHLAIGIAALLIGMAMFALNWIGGGDAKLFAAAALWLGLPPLPTYLIVAGLAGGLLTWSLLFLRSAAVRPLAQLGPPWLGRLAEPKEGVPYGLAIAVGALAAFPSSPLMQGLASPF